METYLAGLGRFDVAYLGGTMGMVLSLGWIAYLVWMLAKEPVDDGQD